MADDNLKETEEVKDKSEKKLDPGIEAWYDSFLTMAGGGKKVDLEDEEQRKRLNFMTYISDKSKREVEAFDASKLYSPVQSERKDAVKELFESARKEELYVYNKDDKTLRRATVGPDGKIKLSEDIRYIRPPKRPGFGPLMVGASKADKAKYRHDKALFDKEARMFSGKKRAVEDIKDFKKDRKAAAKLFKYEQKMKDLEEMNKRVEERVKKRIEENKIKEEARKQREAEKAEKIREKLRIKGRERDRKFFEKRELERKKLEEEKKKLSTPVEIEMQDLSVKSEEPEKKEVLKPEEPEKKEVLKPEEPEKKEVLKPEEPEKKEVLKPEEPKKEEPKKQDKPEISEENNKFFKEQESFDPASNPEELGKAVKRINQIVGSENGLSEETVQAGMCGEKLYSYLKDHPDAMNKAGLESKDLETLKGTVELGKIAGEGLEAREKINQGLENVSPEARNELVNSYMTMNAVNFCMSVTAEDNRKAIESGTFTQSGVQRLLSNEQFDSKKLKSSVAQTNEAIRFKDEPGKLKEVVAGGKSKEALFGKKAFEHSMTIARTEAENKSKTVITTKTKEKVVEAHVMGK